MYRLHLTSLGDIEGINDQGGFSLNTAIVHNPFAGRLDAVNLLPTVCDSLRNLGWSVDLKIADRPSEIGDLVCNAADQGVDAVFVSGGDGSVGAAANVLCGSDVVLGVLPTGTANVWAAELGLPSRVHGRSGWLVRSALIQAHGDIRRVDLGSCGGRCFLLWAGVGLDAHIVQQVEPRTRVSKYFGRPYYILKGLWAARLWKGMPLTVRVDGQVISACMVSVIASNIRLFAGGLINLDPGARVDDGLLSLSCFKGRTFLDGLTHCMRMVHGRHLFHPQVSVVSGRRFVIDGPYPIPMQLDGEVVGKRSKLVIYTLPAALSVFMPQSGKASIFN